MSDDLYHKTNDSIKYWTRDELLARAEAAERRVAELTAELEKIYAIFRDPHDDPRVVKVDVLAEYRRTLSYYESLLDEQEAAAAAHRVQLKVSGDRKTIVEPRFQWSGEVEIDPLDPYEAPPPSQ